MIHKPKKNCKVCDAVLIGRADKKFCSDYCRAVFHQSNKESISPLVQEISKTLLKNRSILRALNPTGKTVLSKSQLHQKGYNFMYHTHSIQTKAGNLYHFCFEEGFMITEQDKLVLVRQEQK
ncbi:MAG TPA: hypothetical protein PK006_11240 [Saprospiraceae bacterium]|nr:hypothetical protein [Saprospiraceae bacterium]